MNFFSKKYKKTSNNFFSLCWQNWISQSC